MNYTSNDSSLQTSKPATYTRVFDNAIRKLKLRDGYVLSLVYRHCQMKRGVFSAGIRNKADDLGLDHRQLRNGLKSLASQGYIKDMTPALKGKPHDYAMTPEGVAILTNDGREMLPASDKHVLYQNGTSRSTETVQQEYQNGIARSTVLVHKDNKKENNEDDNNIRHVKTENNVALVEMDSLSDVVVDSSPFSNPKQQLAKEPSQPVQESVAVEDSNIPAAGASSDELAKALDVIAQHGGGRIVKTKGVKESAVGFVELAKRLADSHALNIPDNINNPAAYVISRVSEKDIEGLLFNGPIFTAEFTQANGDNTPAEDEETAPKRTRWFTEEELENYFSN